MEYEILRNGEVINTIVASENFVKDYCSRNEFTYRVAVSEDVATEPTETEKLRADIDYISAMTGVDLV